MRFFCHFTDVFVSVLRENVIRMNVLIIFIELIVFAVIHSRELPCEFKFDKSFGYTCKVKSFASESQFVEVTKVTGKHETSMWHNYDVFRVIFFNMTISYLPANMTNFFWNIRTLQVKNCGLKALTHKAHFRDLRRLYLGYNQIKVIPTSYFWHFCRLEILSLFHNQISYIPPIAFRDLISLKRLSLNGNNLLSIDSHLFDSILNLEFIDLENNAIESIEGNLFSKQIRLEKIFLRNNLITLIGDGFLLNNTAMLSYATLGANPCIDFSFPDDGDFDRLQQLIASHCAPLMGSTTTTQRTTTTKQTKKQKYQTPYLIFPENCTWFIRKEYGQFFTTPSPDDLKPNFILI
jgi:BspA type Leucine rich repeat region (6 copies)